LAAEGNSRAVLLAEMGKRRGRGVVMAVGENRSVRTVSCLQ
jgi:hypothetical protein